MSWLAVVVSGEAKGGGRGRHARTLVGRNGLHYPKERLETSYVARRQQVIDDLNGDDATRLKDHTSHSRKCNRFEGKGATCTPTTMPTLFLTRNPSLSPSPALNPTDPPTASPAHSPTARPTKSPSTLAPSFKPTDQPSFSSSEKPTPGPTVSPAPTTGFPSPTPSTSFNMNTPTPFPTEVLFDTDESDGLVSTCIADLPSSGGMTQDEPLAFQYKLFIDPSAITTDKIAAMEQKLHNGLAWQFIQCDFDDASSSTASFKVVGIDSKPTDMASSSTCDEISSSNDVPTDPSICIVAEAALSMTLWYSNENRRLQRQLQTTTSNVELRDAVGDYLQESMEDDVFVDDDILKVEFLGFVNVDGSTTVAGGGDATTTSAALGGGDITQPANKTAGVAASSVVVGIAAICLIVFGVVAVRHRRKREEMYLQHLDELSIDHKESDETFDDSDFITSPMSRAVPLDSDGKVEMVINDEGIEIDDNFGLTFGSYDSPDPYHGDVHQCSSATCQICMNRQIRPTFIHTAQSHQDILDDLGQYYRSPDRLSTIEMPHVSDTLEL